MTQQPAAAPLAGLTVIDLTAALAGPYATLLLAGLGARVIKVEPPGRGETARSNAPYAGRDGVGLARRHDDDMSLAIAERARNKLSLTLNLKHPGAAAVFADLVRHADVVVENFSRGTVDRLGVGYAAASSVNPRIVYCSISGFGAVGEPGTGKAMDTIIQALSGLMYSSGAPGEPPVRVGVPMGDLTAPLFAVIGILAAVHLARQTGQGQHVDVSMLGALTSLVASEPAEVLERLGQPLRTGNTVPRLAPFGIFEASDGYFALCAPTDAFAAGVLAAIGVPGLAGDERFASRDQRVRHAGELHKLIEEWSRGRTRAEAVAALEAAGVPAAPVRDAKAAVRDPGVMARGETAPLAHPKYGIIDGVVGSGVPITFSRSRADLTSPAPALGQHNAEILSGLLGYSPDRLAALAAEGIV